MYLCKLEDILKNPLWQLLSRRMNAQQLCSTVAELVFQHKKKIFLSQLNHEMVFWSYTLKSHHLFHQKKSQATPGVRTTYLSPCMASAQAACICSSGDSRGNPCWGLLFRHKYTSCPSACPLHLLCCDAVQVLACALPLLCTWGIKTEKDFS